jgi:hypothetical protein
MALTGGAVNTTYQPVYQDSLLNADLTLATVLRDQWADYLKTYQPVANTLMQQTSYNNPTLIADQVNQGASDVNIAFQNSAINQQQNFQRYGIAPTEGQQGYMNRANSLDKSTAIVDSANKIRANIADRNRSIAAGGIPNVTSQAIQTSIGSAK